MSGLSQSAFLQALGWATLNSFWQMALLWCVFLIATNLFNLSSQKKYYLSAASVIAGALWFFFTLILYYNNTNLSYSFISTQYLLSPLNSFTPLILSAASVAYLVLLLIPVYKLLLNWKAIQLLRKTGIQKAEIQYKLFVKKFAGCLGIKKNVGIYFSELVKSPLTIGYLKPIILLPIASINNLTMQQVEAILLHELSHIRRYDFLVNILLSVIQTVLYFNPFTKLFIRIAQEERENCCDQMVLQFGYDKISYASALLSLEKTSLATHTFVLGAAGKRNLLTRIEKIVGIEKKIAFRFNHFAGFMGALFCILIFNSLLIITKEKNTGPLSFNSLENPFYFFNEKPQNHFKKPLASKAVSLTRKITYEQRKPVINVDPSVVPEPLEEPVDHVGVMPVALNEAEVKLSKEQKDHVKETIENTKKVLSTFQWKEVEKTIGNDLTSREKAAVKQEYLREINKIDWVNMEKNLKTAYNNINWPEIDANMHKALASIQLDSLQINYEIALKAIDKAKEDAKANVVAEQLPLPDASLAEIEKCREQVREHINEIRRIRTKVVVKL